MKSAQKTEKIIGEGETKRCYDDDEKNPVVCFVETFCPKCMANITVEEIKQLCEITKNGDQLQKAVDFFNSNKDFFELTTCTRKVHFLAQIAAETSFSDLEEKSFDYTADALIKNFKPFQTDTGKKNAQKWGREKKNGSPKVTTENQYRIANWAYAGPENELGNTVVANSDLADPKKDGYRYRGRGYLQITGKENYKKVSAYYNEWIAAPNNEQPVDWVKNEGDLTKGKNGMAATMIYWKYSNLISRSDMGTLSGGDALKVVTAKINSGLTHFEKRNSFLSKATKIFAGENCCDYQHRNINIGTVVVVSGKSTEKIAGFAAYPVSVYRGMTLQNYKDWAAKKCLPEPDYQTKLSRDAHKASSTRSNQRYGTDNECPPGTYFLNNKIDAGKYSYRMYLSDTETGSTITYSGEEREDIAIHLGSPEDSVGGLTFFSECYKNCTPNPSDSIGGLRTLSEGKKLISELIDAIPDLFIHSQLKGIKIKRRHVMVIIEEREVDEEKWKYSNKNVTKPWRGKIT